MKQEKSTKLPNGLKLFVADVIDEDTSEQTIWYVVAKTYDTAFKKFTKEANGTWRTYLYYFDEADDDILEDFMDKYENIKAGVYD